MARAHARDEESTGELEFGHARVTVTMVGGVWRELDVGYEEGHGFDDASKGCAAMLRDKRCAHVRSVRIGDVDKRVANALAGLRELEHLTVHEFQTFVPPPGMWPQLRRLDIKAPMSEEEWNYSEYGSEQRFDDLDDESEIPVAACGVDDETVSALAAAAPNLRELRINWTSRLDCLADILAGLPMLEKLRVDYTNVDEDTDESSRTWAIVDSRPLDKVTPVKLQFMHLRQRTAPRGKESYDESAMRATVRLMAMLVRMQHRVTKRFTVELHGTRF